MCSKFLLCITILLVPLTEGYIVYMPSYFLYDTVDLLYVPSFVLLGLTVKQDAFVIEGVTVTGVPLKIGATPETFMAIVCLLQYCIGYAPDKLKIGCCPYPSMSRYKVLTPKTCSL